MSSLATVLDFRTQVYAKPAMGSITILFYLCCTEGEPVITADIELAFLTHSLLSFICAHERSRDLFNRLIESLAQAFLKSHFLMLLRPASSL